MVCLLPLKTPPVIKTRPPQIVMQVVPRSAGRMEAGQGSSILHGEAPIIITTFTYQLP